MTAAANTARAATATTSATQHELAAFYAYDPGFHGGVSVAIGDVTGDGMPTS